MPRLNRFILASASPRRRALLRTLGLSPQIRPANLNETQHPGEKPRAYVRRMALEKALVAIKNLHPRKPIWVLTADTIVVLGSQHILGKPRSRRKAKQYLQRLSGQKHQVLTSCCLAATHRAKAHWPLVTVTSSVTFRKLSQTEIEFYLNTNDWKDKAGGYGIQDKGAFLVKEIRGSFTNIIGLPLTEVVRLLRAQQIL